MRRMTMIAMLIVVVVGMISAMSKPNTGSTHASQAGISSFDLMSTAKDLPVAPDPAAF